MIVTIKDRLTQYVIYTGYVSTGYYKELLKDAAFIITAENIKNIREA